MNEPEFTKRITGTGVLMSNVDLWENGQKLFKVNLTPNPAVNNTVVEFLDLNNLQSVITANLYDVTGKLVQKVIHSVKATELANTEINLADINSGTYYLRIITDGEAGVTIPLKVQK